MTPATRTVAARTRRPGLTLIELTVVLMILIALAGILVPILTGYVQRSHASSASTNSGELVKHWELFNVKYLTGYPDRLDSLLTTAGAVSPRLPDGNPIGLTPMALDPGQLASLNDAGITAVYPQYVALPPGASATYNAADYTAAPTTLAVGTQIAQVPDAWVEAQLNIDPLLSPNQEYVAFGVGDKCTAVGKVMSAAPLHFDQADPQQVYSRFYVVFAVPETGAPVGFKAKFVGVLGSEGDGLGGHLGEYFKPDAQ